MLEIMTMNKNLKHILRIMVEYLAIDMSAKLIRVINGKADETANLSWDHDSIENEG